MEEDKPTWNFFEDILPPEVTTSVFSFLELEDVVYVSLVCKSWSTYFDTKDIWKHIYEKNFGQLDEKTVDLNQNLRWKRLFVQASNLNRKWNRDFTQPQQTFRCNAQISDQLVVANRYHILIASSCTAVVDLRLAAKLVQVKHNPVTLHCHNISDVTTVISTVKAHSEPKPPKDDTYTIPYFHINSPHTRYSNGRGDFLLRHPSTYRFALWNAESQLISQNKTNSILMLTPTDGSLAWCFNSKFAAYNNRQLKTYDVHIIDLSKRCSHCCVATLKNGEYVPEAFSYPCQPLSPYCAIIERHAGPVDWIYASQFNPNILVLAYYNRMLIWRHGLFEESVEVKLPDVKTFTNCGEHWVEGLSSRHWFTYTTTNQTGARTTFMDFNNVSNKLEMPALSKYLFVPKKSKVLCVLHHKIIAFDLDQKVWLSKMTVPNPVRAMTFNKSASILFVATTDHIYAYQWEIGRLISSFAHDNTEVNAIHFVLDQVFVISSPRRADYMKIRTKLEF